MVFAVVFSCQTKHKQSPQIKSQAKVIDINTTTDSLVLFGEHVISTPLYERDLAISPQGNELIYTLGDYKQNKRCLVSLNFENGEWTDAQILNISGQYQDIEPFYSNNGNRLYFASNRPIYNDNTRTDYNIWYSDRIESAWSEPIALDSVINTKNDEFFPSLTTSGNLYFTATRADGIGREDIFVSEYLNGQYLAPKPLPEAINTPLFEFNAYISPDENLIIFSSFGRADGLGGGDLYISQKDKTGQWTASKNLGKLVNSTALDFCPFIDWKSRSFYFTSERLSLNNNKLEQIESLKQIANHPLNGFGNIYKISLDSIL
ncbi:WD40 repeat protein [Olleya aquimaris]|uniref:WD40 repeat protein n=2 Tax=Olleya aquimaris TaxID=639310 RepID=A0A327RGP6_9FLAO|nr:WD40 repeat protein [Olleya aquimaris]